MAIDPVCKMTVDEKKAVATSDYKGKKYYFCAVSCKKAFDQNPEKYLAQKKSKPMGDEEPVSYHRRGHWFEPSTAHCAVRTSDSLSQFSSAFISNSSINLKAGETR